MAVGTGQNAKIYMVGGAVFVDIVNRRDKNLYNIYLNDRRRGPLCNVLCVRSYQILSHLGSLSWEPCRTDRRPVV